MNSIFSTPTIQRVHLSKVIMASNMANAAKTTMIAMATISANTIKRLPQTAILEILDMKRPSSAFMVSKTLTTILKRSVSWSGRPESDLFSLFDQRINTYTF